MSKSDFMDEAEKNGQLRTTELKIHGMTCQSCEVLIERKLKKIPHIKDVQVNAAKGTAQVTSAQNLDLGELQQALTDSGYTITGDDDVPVMTPKTKKEYIEIAAIALILAGVYFVLKRFSIFPDVGVSDSMTLGIVFLVGIVASLSTCLAVTGGLLVSATAAYNERHPNLTGMRKFSVHAQFNIGRILSYTFFGGLIGAIGSSLALSPKITGILTIIASIIMVLLGVQLLGIFPWAKKFQLRMPKALAHWIYDKSGKERQSLPFMLGAGTFFLPCGFTQALQLYVLSRGDIVTGALTMLVFSLGTLPALASLGAVTSFSTGTFKRYITKSAAVLAIAVGIWSMGNGLALAGSPLTTMGVLDIPSSALPSQAANEVQVVEMRVDGLGYSPHRFTIKQGIPVEWRIDGRNAQGCAQVITAPSLGITEYLPRDKVKVIRFTPAQAGNIAFSCTMGMTTRGAGFIVVPNDASARYEDTQEEKPCDPAVTSCDVQKLSMRVTEQGYSQRVFRIKKDIPVEMEIETTIPIRGCMGTIVIPDYGVAHRLDLGKTTLRFTPTKKGTSIFTCSMGSKMGEFIIA